jgi:hypothetical protein
MKYVSHLNTARQKLIRILNYVGALIAFPLAVALLVGVFGHSVSLGIRTFLLIECAMAVLVPLLDAVIRSGDHSRHNRGK